MWRVGRAFGMALLILVGLMWASTVAPSDKREGFFSSAFAGSAVIGGYRMQCPGARVRFSRHSPGVGFAVRGEIVFNRKLMRRYPVVTQRMIFLHECAHQYVGRNETAADCWAIRTAKSQGWLSERGVHTVCRSFAGSNGSRTHLAGPQRCAAMLRCFRGRAPALTAGSGGIVGTTRRDAR